jgi:hypothetical protein
MLVISYSLPLDSISLEHRISNGHIIGLGDDLLPTVAIPLTRALNLLSAATLAHRFISFFATYMYGIFESLCDVRHERIFKSLRKFLNPCFDASVLFWRSQWVVVLLVWRVSCLWRGC